MGQQQWLGELGPFKSSLIPCPRSSSMGSGAARHSVTVLSKMGEHKATMGRAVVAVECWG